ncbi:MAG TPA: DoxX family protein [Ktedonobacterales bacterium]
MNIVLWISQGLLAAAYVMAGGMKAGRPIDMLGKSMEWVRAVPAGFVRFIGAAEVLGAVGLILPMVTGTLPGLTVAAAVGLVVVQVGAIIVHVTRHEVQKIPTNIVLLLLAVFVAIGRLAIVPV